MDSEDLLTELDSQRQRRWHQARETRIARSEDAIPFIERAGVVTHFPASAEFPNLFHAYTGDPTAVTDSGHSTPSGDVYAWRWELGQRSAGFYGVIVRKRPTWVSRKLLPAVLRLRGESRAPAQLYEAGLLSAGALRVAEALGDAPEPLPTGELRRLSGFPTGTDQRRAFLKAIAELDTRLLLARVFMPDSTDTFYQLSVARFPIEVEAGHRLMPLEAASSFVETYLPAAVYFRPKTLAKHFGVQSEVLVAAADAIVAAGRAESVQVPSSSDALYIWRE